MDINDSVGILDSYFPECRFFLDENEFINYIKDEPIDYLVVCSPNYQHYLHCITGVVFMDCDVICEKPLVITTEGLKALSEKEASSYCRIYSIMQLRLHHIVKEMKAFIASECIVNNPILVEADYRTPRGDWYYQSWKNDINKSGGIAFNVGIHLFDLLTHLLGNDIDPEESHFMLYGRSARGALSHKDKNIKVEWFLSTHNHYGSQRIITINGREFDLSNGFTDLHTESYRQILAGNGFGIEDVRPSIALTEIITQQLYRP
jgi:UDP-N-acetyl-2-amino-2-deoxyglucuronate dehydrogenase